MSLKQYRKQGKKVWNRSWKRSPKKKNYNNDNWSLGRARMQAREENRKLKKLARRAERRENKKLEKETD